MLNRRSLSLLMLMCTTLLAVSCQSPNACNNPVCHPPTASPVPEWPSVNELAKKAQDQATTQWHLSDAYVSPGGKWALGRQDYNDRITFQQERHYVTRSRSDFGLLNLTTQEFKPLATGEDAQTAFFKTFWLSDQEYLAIVRPGVAQPLELRQYQVDNGSFTVKARAENEDEQLQAWHNAPWFVYQKGSQLTVLNLQTQDQKTYGPIEPPIKQWITSKDGQSAYIVTSPLANPDTFRTQISPPFPQMLYHLDFAREKLEVLNPPQDLTYHGVNLSLSPNNTRLLISTSMTAYGQGMSSLMESTTQTLYAADVQPLGMLGERKANTERSSSSDAQSVWFDHVFWLDEAQFFTYRVGSSLKFIDGSQNPTTAAPTTLSTQAFVLGMNTSHQLVWLEQTSPKTVTLKLKAPQSPVRELQSWKDSEVVARSAQVSDTKVWFEVQDAERRVSAYVLDMATLQLQALPERKVQWITPDFGPDNSEGWYVQELER